MDISKDLEQEIRDIICSNISDDVDEHSAVRAAKWATYEIVKLLNNH